VGSISTVLFYYDAWLGGRRKVAVTRLLGRYIKEDTPSQADALLDKLLTALAVDCVAASTPFLPSPPQQYHATACCAACKMPMPLRDDGSYDPQHACSVCQEPLHGGGWPGCRNRQWILPDANPAQWHCSQRCHDDASRGRSRTRGGGGSSANPNPDHDPDPDPNLYPKSKPKPTPKGNGKERAGPSSVSQASQHGGETSSKRREQRAGPSSVSQASQHGVETSSKRRGKQPRAVAAIESSSESGSLHTRRNTPKRRKVGPTWGKSNSEKMADEKRKQHWIAWIDQEALKVCHSSSSSSCM
jgi:hypothetical protein